MSSKWNDRNKIIPENEQPKYPNMLGVALIAGAIQLCICAIIAGAINIILWILQWCNGYF